MAIRLAPLDLTHRALPPLKCVQPPISPFYTTSVAVPLNLPPLPAPTTILPASTGVPTPLFSSPPPSTSIAVAPPVAILPPIPVTKKSSLSLSASSGKSKSISKRRKRSNGELFRCTYPNCRKTTTEHSNLKAHMRLHTGETPYVCTKPDCGKRFRWKSSLTYHEKALHSNLRPYGCDACHKRFVEKRKLRLHIDWCPTRHQKVAESNTAAAAKATASSASLSASLIHSPVAIPSRNSY